MIPSFPEEPERLTDGSTWYWSRVFPTLWSVVVGGIVVLLWLDAVGGEPVPLAVKKVATAVWVVLSAAFFRMVGGLKEVWLDGNDLLVGDPTRGFRISLRDVRRVRESRLRQVKSVTLELARPTPWGSSITFVPKGIKTFLFPYTSSPVAAALQERTRHLLRD